MIAARPVDLGVWARPFAQRRSRPRCLARTTLLGLAFSAFAVSGQVPVEESAVTAERSPPATVDPQPPVANARQDDAGQSGLGTLYYELQVLQDEVRRLNGIVEEQNHRIERLSQEHRERYIELDQRILELGQGPSASPGDPLAEGGQTLPAQGVPGAASGPLTEREAYNAAIQIVGEARSLPAAESRPQFARALAMFRDLIRKHPNGEQTPNAFYWIGEMQLALDELELARQAFAQIVLLYDDHPKVPEALYKLGVVYHQLGDLDRAREHLNRVIGEHPASTAAGLASAYLSELP